MTPYISEPELPAPERRGFINKARALEIRKTRRIQEIRNVFYKASLAARELILPIIRVIIITLQPTT